MATPFKFAIRQFGAGGEGPFKDVSAYFHEEHDLSEGRQREIVKIEITENRDLDICFTSSHGARLYMDGLHYWHPHRCKEDDQGDIYIETAAEPIVLFKNGVDAEKSGYYPFIPGTYRIYIECDGKRYFSYLDVLAKQVTHQELGRMRQELEAMIENLAKKRIESGSAERIEASGNMLDQIQLLGENARNLIGVMDQIRRAPRTKIEKTYVLKKTDHVGEIDRETIKYRLRHPNQSDVLLIPEREISQNLPENQAMIQAVSHILKISKKALSYLGSINAHTDLDRKDASNLLSHRSAIKKLKNTCVLFLNEHWVKEVKAPAVHAHGLRVDARYRFISQMSRKLKKPSTRRLRLNEGYSYTWQRTDKLYEMWCFIRLIHALQSEKLGFVPNAGWIYDNGGLLGHWQIPFLNEGTTIEFVKGAHLRLRLIYDGRIESEMGKTSFDNPLYTEFPQNRPDARLDVYRNNVYEGSVVIDFKYRPAYTIGTFNEYHNPSYAYKQLLHYSKFDSAFTGKSKDDVSQLKKTRRAPISEVWVMYPGSETGSGEIECVNDWLMKIPYRPSESLEKLETLLTSALQNIQEDSVFVDL